mmetsp:Transcript_37514/g.98383  ORF Transcript_37514/g.98383 Transcript_37514/m.98383 type:complete len:83 (+) Transcript_37514:256-504(+)
MPRRHVVGRSRGCRPLGVVGPTPEIAAVADYDDRAVMVASTAVSQPRRRLRAVEMDVLPPPWVRRWLSLTPAPLPLQQGADG